MRKKILLLELNEFNRELLEVGSKLFRFPHIQWLFDLKQSETLTEDTLQSDRLDPWVQWVSVHTGTPSTEHKIKHLGDIPDLKTPQLWEKLSDRGVTTGVWGPLNANRGEAPLCQFFVPDPWTFSEVESPESLRGLVDFPRYMAQNRVGMNPFVALRMFLHFCRMVPVKVWWTLIRHSGAVLRSLWAYRFSASILFTIFEFASAGLFIQKTKQSKPQVAILFVNFFAHFQHYYWPTGDLTSELKKHPKYYWALFYLDLLIGQLRSSLGKEYALVVYNALSQESVLKDKLAIYRVTHYETFFSSMKLPFKNVKPLMTYDATVFFIDEKERDFAAKFLSGLKIDGQPVFFIETEGHPTDRLFLRTIYFGQSTAHTKVIGSGVEFLFNDYFSFLGYQTGRHIQTGTIFSEEINFPRRLPNHEFTEFIL